MPKSCGLVRLSTGPGMRRGSVRQRLQPIARTERRQVRKLLSPRVFKTTPREAVAVGVSRDAILTRPDLHVQTAQCSATPSCGPLRQATVEPWSRNHRREREEDIDLFVRPEERNAEAGASLLGCVRVAYPNRDIHRHPRRVQDGPAYHGRVPRARESAWSRVAHWCPCDRFTLSPLDI